MSLLEQPSPPEPGVLVASPPSELFDAAYRGHACHVHGLARHPTRLPVHAWQRAAASDSALVDHCHGTTLDIGCGPGRMVELLAERGRPALGIDVVPEAIRQTRDRGCCAFLVDVFDGVPGEGRWDTALLADGNIGIGGDPAGLLTRLHQLLTPTGRVVADVAEPGTGVRTSTVELTTAHSRSEAFPWAVVGAEAIGTLGAEAGFAATVVHRTGDRWYAVLRKRP